MFVPSMRACHHVFLLATMDHMFPLLTPPQGWTRIESRKKTALHIKDSMAEQPCEFVIAVVDDDEGILRSIEYLLESADHAVRLFRSGAELLDSGLLPEIDCVISDIDMPGMDGFELLRRVHAARPELPAILITGYPDTVRRLPLPGEGNPRFFTKPFQGPELLAAVADALRGSRGG
jgi:FixJ family two-component response regulator